MEGEYDATRNPYGAHEIQEGGNQKCSPWEDMAPSLELKGAASRLPARCWSQAKLQNQQPRDKRWKIHAAARARRRRCRHAIGALRRRAELVWGRWKEWVGKGENTDNRATWASPVAVKRVHKADPITQFHTEH